VPKYPSAEALQPPLHKEIYLQPVHSLGKYFNLRISIKNLFLFHILFTSSFNISPRFIHQRIENKIHAKLLTEGTKETIETWKKNDKKELRETRFISELKTIPLTEYIYGNCVAILGTDIQNPLGIIIRHKDFAEQQRILFHLLWDNLKE